MGGAVNRVRIGADRAVDRGRKALQGPKNGAKGRKNGTKGTKKQDQNSLSQIFRAKLLYQLMSRQERARFQGPGYQWGRC